MNKLILQAVAALVVVVAMWFGWRAVKNHYIEVGKAEVQAKWDADKAARKKAEDAAIAKRAQDNALEKERQDAIVDRIKEQYNVEIGKLRNDVATAKRVRVGTAICGQGTSSPTKASGTEGSNVANPGAGLVREDVERDIRALMINVEEALATGRACQNFLIDNGFTSERR